MIPKLWDQAAVLFQHENLSLVLFGPNALWKYGICLMIEAFELDDKDRFIMKAWSGQKAKMLLPRLDSFLPHDGTSF